MADYKFNYDTEASGPFTEGEILTLSGSGSGIVELVLLYDNGAEGEMYVSEIGAVTFADNAVITGGTSAATAAINGAPFLSRFPLKIRDDLTFTSATGAIRLDGGAPALGTTHSCKYDGEATGPFVVGEILTFGTSNSTAELIALIDNGLDGELFFRMIDVDLPVDNEVITSSGTGAALVDGAVHARCYTPNNIHYWFSDKGDDAAFTGNDEQDRTKPRISKRIGVTDVELLGNANIDDALSYRVYGGSISQVGGDDEYNAVSIAVVDADGSTEPVVIQASGNNSVLLSATTTEYWKNGYMPNSSSRINMLVKVKAGGVVIDRRVVRFRALEFQRQYFTAPDPTMVGGITPVSLVATDDGNNATLEGTVAGHTDILFTEGFQSIDHSNGNGARPYWLTLDLGATKTKSQGHERYKWVQRRGTAETIHGINAQLIVGNDLTFAYDGEGNTVQFTEGEVITFTGNSTGSALILALDDQGITGNLYCQRLTGDVPLDNAVITGVTSGETAVVNGTPIDRLIINNLAGTYTGSAFNPANIGVTLNSDDADENDLFKDLLEANQAPPINRSGSASTEIGDIVTFYPWDGSALDAVGDQAPDFVRLTSNGLISGATVTTLTVNETIPTWMPKTGGYIRATLVSGLRKLIPVTSWSGLVITIPSTDFSGDNLANAAGIMPAPVDETATAGTTSFSGVYSANQDKAGTADQKFVIKVTRGSDATPKQPNIGTASFGSGGFSVNVSLQDD